METENIRKQLKIFGKAFLKTTGKFLLLTSQSTN